MDDFIDLLNPQQQLAVAAPEGPVLILAGPGSGKTRVLTYRIAYLVGVMNVPPYNILAVTFTNKAAREMAARVEKILVGRGQGIWLGTFHAICGRILRREADLLPVNQNFVIFDADDQESLMKNVLRELNLDDKILRPNAVLDAVSKAKNDLILPADYPIQTFRDEQVQKCYRYYQQQLVRNNAMDFDDMLVYTNAILAEYPQVRDTYAHKFEHILVDEFQDTNFSQYAILKHFASKHRNLYVVGDEDQSIYRWRGADYRNITRFQSDFKESRTILLEQNYRSTQTILDGAMAVIDRNPNRTHKRLFTEVKKGERITLYVAGDEHEEAQYVADAIRRATQNNKVNPGDFAIMYRTNAQSRLLEEAFRREGLSYRLVGAQRFYGRKEVRDVIAFLRLIHNPQDEISLKRVINLPPRGIGEKTLEKLADQAKVVDLTMGEMLLLMVEPESKGLTEALGREGARLAAFGRMLQTWRSTAHSTDLPSLFDHILADVGYQEYIQDRSEEGLDRWENVLELREVLLEYQDLGLESFLEAMALVADQDTLPENVDAPTMLTLHAAKGLEFEHVFITGLDEMLLPHSRSRDEPEALAEERRLLYVGITRAKKHLTLTRANRRRSPYGGYEDTMPSRFLEDLPEELLQGSPRGLPGRLSYSPRSSFSRWEVPVFSQPKRRTEAPQKKYQTGMQVRHATYGRGVVKTSRLEHGDETVEVYFEGVGLKALVASLAKLEIL